MRTRRVAVAALLGSCGVFVGATSAFASCPCGPTLSQLTAVDVAKGASQFGRAMDESNKREIRDRIWYDQHTPSVRTAPPFQFTSDPNKIDQDLLADTNFDPDLLAYPDLLGYT